MRNRLPHFRLCNFFDIKNRRDRTHGGRRAASQPDGVIALVFSGRPEVRREIQAALYKRTRTYFRNGEKPSKGRSRLRCEAFSAASVQTCRSATSPTDLMPAITPNTVAPCLTGGSATCAEGTCVSPRARAAAFMVVRFREIENRGACRAHGNERLS